MAKIIVPWENQSNVWWNETCANVIEHFGLPGGKYTTAINEDAMQFDFPNEHDELMCRILISDAVK